MKISHINVINAANEGVLERRRRSARKAFNAAIDWRSNLRLWMLINPYRQWDPVSSKYGNVTSVRLIVRVSQWHNGMIWEHTVSGWVTPTAWTSDSSGMMDLAEETKISSMAGSNPDWGIKPDIEEMREYARIVIDCLGGDCLTELRVAALAGERKNQAVIGT
jgi:hypothetical protein